MARPVTVGLNLTANTLTTVYTVPTGYYAKWNLMYLFNGTGSTKSMTVYWTDTSASADIYVLNQNNISSKEYLRIDGGAYVVMEEGDKVMMQSETGSSFSTICTFELFKKDGV
jgi:hypothetical protein